MTQEYNELLEVQKALESAAVSDGVERYRRTSGDKPANEKVSGQQVIKEALEPVLDVLRGFVVAADEGKANRSAAYIKFLNLIDLRTVAFIGLNVVFNKFGRTDTELKMAIGSALEDELNVIAFRSGYGLEEGDREGLMRYFETEMNKRASRANRRVYINKALSHVENFKKLGWDDDTRSRLGGLILDSVLSVSNLFVKVMRAEHIRGSLRTIRYIEPTPELIAKIGQMDAFLELQRPVFGPMIVPPKHWDRKLEGGYLTKKLPLIKGANLNYLGDALESGKLDATFSALNMLQDTAWAINIDVLEVARELFSANSTIAGLPDHGELEKPAKPAGAKGREEQFAQENHAEWKAWKKASAEHYAWARSAERLGKILEVSNTLSTATRYAEYEALHFVYQLDFRGRMYPVSTGLNPQGDDLSHGLLTFANGKLMTEEAAVWLAVHGANAWANEGLDKKSFTVRHAWVMNNENHILASAADPLNYTWWARAENPWQFLSFCFEWNGWKSEGTDFVTTLPISADGSCNGIQHYAAMLRDETEGAAVNLVPGDEPADIYSCVAKSAAERVMKDAVEGTEELLAAALNESGEVKAPAVLLKDVAAALQPYVNRKFVKRGVMTTPYGVSKYGVRDQLKDEQKDLWKSLDKRIQPVALSYATSVVADAIGSAVSSATKGMEFLQGCAKVAAESDLPIVFSTFDGFPVQVAHTKSVSRRIRTTLSGGLNIKINAVSAFRGDLEKALTKVFGETTSWAVMSELSYNVCHGQMTDPEFVSICRDLLTCEFDPAVIEFVVQALPELVAKHLNEQVEEDASGKRIVSYFLLEPTAELDKLKQVRAMGPHFVHAADACHLRLTLNALKEMGIQSFAAVHDSYAVHATDYELMSRVLREQFVEMHKADLFERFREDLRELVPEDKLEELPEVPAKGGLDLEQVIESDYFFA